MPKEETVVALDIGSSKFTAVVATVSATKTSVIGAHSVSSKGVKDGVINNIDQAVEAISKVLTKVEMMSGHLVSSAVITVSGTHIESLNSHGVVAVSGDDHEIVREDLLRVNDAAQAVSLPSTREIIHVVPREYVVDKQRGVSNPAGMAGFRLEVEANIIHGSTTTIKNLTKCVKQVGDDVEGLVYSGLASAEIVLTETEKKLGALLLDIGGGTIDMMVYTNGKPVYAAVLPIGGQSITNDLAVKLRTLLSKAEEVKKRMSDKELYKGKGLDINMKSKKTKSSEIQVGDLDIGVETVSKDLVRKVIDHRLIELFRFVSIYLKKSGYDKKLPSGIVITGGTANIMGIDKIAESVFSLPVRVGGPSGMYGLIDQIKGPEYSAVLGAIKNHSKSFEFDRVRNSSRRGTISGVKSRITSMFKSFLP